MHRSEDLAGLTFQDQCFDLFVTSDVFEQCSNLPRHFVRLPVCCDQPACISGTRAMRERCGGRNSALTDRSLISSNSYITRTRSTPKDPWSLWRIASRRGRRLLVDGLQGLQRAAEVQPLASHGRPLDEAADSAAIPAREENLTTLACIYAGNSTDDSDRNA